MTKAALIAGQQVNGDPLTAVGRDLATGLGKGQVSVGFLYGDCELPPGEGGCALLVEVSNEPACVRNLSLYGSRFPIPHRTTVRGVPAAFFENGSRLEIQTERTTVVIFGDSRKSVLKVAKALSGVNVHVLPGEPLPAPAPGALDGTLRCKR